MLIDTRKYDRKHGLANDLTKELIVALLAESCSYCGDKPPRMTLDRIDNNLGHTKDNVLPSCLMCNYVRRDMPYAAWKVVAVAVREARERGLLAGWWAGARRALQNSCDGPKLGGYLRDDSAE